VPRVARNRAVGEGSGVGELKCPTGVAVDGAGKVFVADCDNHRIQVFDAKGEVVRVFGREGSGTGELKRPAGVAVDGAGNVFVADCLNDRIQVFDAKGEVVRVFGREGCGVGELKKPTGVAVDGAGKVFVADNYNHHIQVFDVSSQLQGHRTAEGSLGPLVAKLYTVMNEMVVAVSSGEVHASVVYMRGFAQLHRLLLALALDDPAILAAVRQRVDKFLNHPDSG
jgi:DNA-binding beta-propeller fold protein YncE